MMLIILDQSPIKSAELVPDKIKFKQLIELGQLICSCGISKVYKPIHQGKELQKWVKNNAKWVLKYYNTLFVYCCGILNIQMSTETINKILDIRNDLEYFCDNNKFNNYISTGVFRYQNTYANSIYPSKTELPINECIKEYEKYVQWKGEKWNVVL